MSRRYEISDGQECWRSCFWLAGYHRWVRFIARCRCGARGKK